MGGCLLAEGILECHIIRCDRGNNAGFRVSIRVKAIWTTGDLWTWKFLEAVLMAEFAPANYLTGVPSDLWRMKGEPGASQDDVHSGCGYQE